MKARKIGLVTTGSLAALLAAGLLAGAAWVANANTDPDGYIVTGNHPVQTVGHAVASRDLDVDSAFDWVLDRGPRLRISAESSKPLFIGIARSDDVQRYLAGITYDEVTDFDIEPLALTTQRHTGAAKPAAPTKQSFWIASVHGTGTQMLEWDGDYGRLAMVVMNADGSAGVDADVSFGAYVPHLTWIGVGAGVAGAVLLALAASLIYLAARPIPRRALPPTPTAPAA